jgi:hypothetical protein
MSTNSQIVDPPIKKDQLEEWAYDRLRIIFGDNEEKINEVLNKLIIEFEYIDRTATMKKVQVLVEVFARNAIEEIK